jgi:A/G-specific adenine glycosylase
MRSVCVAFAEGTSAKFPVMKKKAKVPHIIVGAAVTVNRKGEVLIAQRKQDDMLGGLWEFPGGKQEPGETIEECIIRELCEELGIKTVTGEHVVTVKHAYSHFTMTMHVYRARIISGRPRPIHCADYAWVNVPDLGKFAWSKADLQVVRKLVQSE